MPFHRPAAVVSYESPFIQRHFSQHLGGPVGLDAFVPCRCFTDGNISDFPYDPSLISVTNGLAEPRRPAGTMPDSQWEELSYAIYKWLRNACAHPDQMYVSARIGNHYTVSMFEEQLHGGGATKCTAPKFPNLLSIMPRTGREILPPELAAEALDELAAFCQIQTDITGWALVNEQDGSEFCHSHRTQIVAGRDRISIEYGADGITVRKLGKIILQSRRVQQRINYGIATLVGDDGSCYTGLGIGTKPANWTVQQRPLTGADFPCVAPLKQVLTASVGIAMPVHLCN